MRTTTRTAIIITIMIVNKNQSMAEKSCTENGDRGANNSSIEPEPSNKKWSVKHKNLMNADM